MEKVIIVNPEKLEKIKSAIKKDGPGKLHILSDFDRTLTKILVSGKKVLGMMSLLYNGNYLPPAYNVEAQKQHQKYYPIEINPKVPLVEKKKAMKEWWNEAFKLVIKFGLEKQHIKSVASSPKLRLRQGFAEMENFLEKNKVPLVIMSSSGLGGDGIRLFLEKSAGRRNNIYVISNFFNWDKNGKAVSIKRPIVCGMHKDETLVRDYPKIFRKVERRKNVILMGDSLDDVEMVTGFDYDNLIKIGFLNENVEENMEYYKRAFDVLILNDGSMRYINKLLKEIIKQ